MCFSGKKCILTRAFVSLNWKTQESKEFDVCYSSWAQKNDLLIDNDELKITSTEPYSDTHVRENSILGFFCQGAKLGYVSGTHKSYITYDLGKSYKIKQVSFATQVPETAMNIKIIIGQDSDYSNNQVFAEFEKLTLNFFDAFLPKGTMGRFVTIQQTSNPDRNLHLGEIKIIEDTS